MHDHTMIDHEGHIEPESTPKEYAKFAVIILGILLISYFTAVSFGGLGVSNFLRVFMGVFFLVFGLFKLLDLRGFVMSYIGYDIIAKRSMTYAWVYPFIEIALAVGYFFSFAPTEWITIVIMTIGSIGVLKELMRGSKIKCACLGTYVKLPLTTVSLVEDLTMGIMALLLILKVF